MDINSLIEGFGFPIACVLGLVWYINKKDEEAKEDRRIERENDKIEKERLYAEILANREVNKVILSTNQEVSETNKLLAKDFTEKFDNMDKKMDKILEEVRN